MGILEVLLILFIVLKALGILAWSWWVVFIPLYVDVVLYLAWFGAVALIFREASK